MSNQPQIFPDQPDEIRDDSRDLPAVERATERVRAYVTESGDGLYDVFHGAPLYGRDLEALCRAADTVVLLAQRYDDLKARVLAGGWSLVVEEVEAAELRKDGSRGSHGDDGR
jgi:hypothetical protein